MANFENMNHLSPELKILIVNGQTLVEETRKKMKENSWSVDLTGKLQLKSDCAEVEKLIKKIGQGKMKSNIEEDLRLAIIRLQTSADGLLSDH